MCAKPTPPDYEAIEANMWRDNAAQVVPDLDDGDKQLLKRIETYRRKFGYEHDIIKDEIRNNEMFAVTFAKRPGNTSFHERVAAEWLQKELNLQVDVLPKSGKNAFYITSDGAIMRVDKDERKASKSLDFHWEVNNTIFYAMHKYTRESGGSQDNQSKEMVGALQSFLRATNRNKVFIVIVDGAYYTEAKMSELQSLIRDREPKSFAVHIEDVPAIVKKYR